MNTGNKISSVVLTKNEEDRIKECLKSLSWCDEILVIDDYSTDGTLKEIKSAAKGYEFKNCNVRILQRKLNSDFSSQRNFGIQSTLYDWVLFVDADEVVSEKLKKEIKAKIDGGRKIAVSGFYIYRTDFFLGKKLRFGETGRIKFLRLGSKWTGQWTGKVHEVWQIKGLTETFRNPLLHYSHRNIASFLDKINRYSDIVAQYWIGEGRKSDFFQIVFVPILKFKYNYILKLGFLDGIQGFIMAAMMSFHSFLVRSKVFLHQNK